MADPDPTFFLNADPDPAAFLMPIQIQLQKFEQNTYEEFSVVENKHIPVQNC